MKFDGFHNIVVVHQIGSGVEMGTYERRMTVLHLLSCILVEIDSNKGPDAIIDQGNPFSFD